MLIPCRSCARHVDASGTACPFCGEPIDGPLPTRRVAAERLSRAAMVLLGATSLGACDRVKDTSSSGTVVQPYGAPYIPDEAGVAVALYGAPPAPNTGDAGSVVTPPTAIAAPYGAPPIRPDADTPQPRTPDAGPKKK